MWAYLGGGVTLLVVSVLIGVWWISSMSYANRERKLAQGVVTPPPPVSQNPSVQNASVEMVTVSPGMPIRFDFMEKGVDFDSLLILVNPKTWSDSLMVKIAMCESYGGNQYELGDSTRTIVLQGKGNRHDTGIMQINQEAHGEILSYLFGIEDSLKHYDIRTLRGNINFAHRLREVKRNDGKTGFAEFEDWNASAECWKKDTAPSFIPASSQVIASGVINRMIIDLPADGKPVGPLDVNPETYTYALEAERIAEVEVINEKGERFKFLDSPNASIGIGKAERIWLRVTDGMPARYKFSRYRL